jgi:raffinose/stachyose/melibiose transport system permease protein
MKRYTWKTLILEGIMLFAGIIFVIPFYILFNLSIKDPREQSSSLVPASSLKFDNYTDAWVKAELGHAMLTSIVITSISVILIVLISVTAAYPLARMGKKLTNRIYWLFLCGLLIPFQLGLIPMYQTMRDLHLLGSIWSLIIVYVGLQMPFSIFLYCGFIRVLPRDYEEAAWVDGANHFLTFWKVVFPLLRPITSTVLILNVIFIWNDFLSPLLYLSGTSNLTIPLTLFNFVGQWVSDWPLVFAGLVISTIPILALFFSLQKSVMNGFAGGVKG